MTPEVVSVPTRGIERWLTQQLSAHLGASDGRQDGVCANIDFPFPGPWSPLRWPGDWTTNPKRTRGCRSEPSGHSSRSSRPTSTSPGWRHWRSTSRTRPRSRARGGSRASGTWPTSSTAMRCTARTCSSVGQPAHRSSTRRLAGRAVAAPAGAHRNAESGRALAGRLPAAQGRARAAGPPPATLPLRPDQAARQLPRGARSRRQGAERSPLPHASVTRAVGPAGAFDRAVVRARCRGARTRRREYPGIRCWRRGVAMPARCNWSSAARCPVKSRRPPSSRQAATLLSGSRTTSGLTARRMGSDDGGDAAPPGGGRRQHPRALLSRPGPPGRSPARRHPPPVGGAIRPWSLATSSCCARTSRTSPRSFRRHSERTT